VTEAKHGVTYDRDLSSVIPGCDATGDETATAAVVVLGNDPCRRRLATISYYLNAADRAKYTEAWRQRQGNKGVKEGRPVCSK
jgi:hypothetical protein